MTILAIVMMGAMLAFIAWAAVAALRGAGRRRPERDPRSVLDDRFAAGGTDEEGYERRRRMLERSRS